MLHSRPGERFSPNCIKTTVKQRNAVWETFTVAGVGELIRCEMSINAKEYIRILETGLLPSIEKLGISQNIILQQDNAPAHTAKVTKKGLANNSIDVMFWPGQSPNLNPMENIWSIISRALTGRIFQTKTNCGKLCKVNGIASPLHSVPLWLRACLKGLIF